MVDVPKIHNGERIVSLKSGDGKTGYLHAKEGNCTLILYHKQNQLKVGLEV